MAVLARVVRRALAALVAASRVYLGVHWATDVLAAAALGTVWALTVIIVHLLSRRRSVARQDHELPGLGTVTGG